MRELRLWIPREARAFENLCSRRESRFPPEVLKRAGRIIDSVRRGGDTALLRAIRRYDRARVTKASLKVRPARFRAAWSSQKQETRRALSVAWENIRKFHRKQAGGGYAMSTPHGRFAHLVRPLDRVGIHVSAGSAPLVSTLLMCAGAARAAGVRDLVMISPPRGRAGIASPILAAAHLAGIREAYAMGGAHGVAALVYGTESVARVDKVVGPGHIITQAAKLLTQGGGGLEGPSEIVILAAPDAPPEPLAADLIAQAEHTGDNLAVLITPSAALARSVQGAMASMLRNLPRVSRVRASLAKLGAIILVRSLREGLAVANAFAPEHLALVGRRAERMAGGVRHAGTLLIGTFSPVAAADYGAGPNHVLPTAGTARYASGLGVKDFVKHINVTRLSARGLKSLGPFLARIARLEGLEAHARSMEMNRG